MNRGSCPTVLDIKGQRHNDSARRLRRDSFEARLAKAGLEVDA